MIKVENLYLCVCVQLDAANDGLCWGLFCIGSTSLERGSANIDSLKGRGCLVDQMDCNIFHKTFSCKLWFFLRKSLYQTKKNRKKQTATLSTDFTEQFPTDQWIKPFIKIHRQKSFHRSHTITIVGVMVVVPIWTTFQRGFFFLLPLRFGSSKIPEVPVP